MSVIVLVLGMALLGGLLIYLAWLCLGEYKALFIRNHRLLMSLEVFSYLVKMGGPGYLAAVLFTAGGIMVLSASYAMLSLLAHWVL